MFSFLAFFTNLLLIDQDPSEGLLVKIFKIQGLLFARAHLIQVFAQRL
jgi:hypothetical protein